MPRRADQGKGRRDDRDLAERSHRSDFSEISGLPHGFPRRVRDDADEQRGTMMKGYLNDSEPVVLRLVRGCLTSLGLIILLLLGSCAFDRLRGEMSIRADLPPQLEPSLFVDSDICSTLFGGYSYMVRISPDAVRELRRQGPGWLAQPAGSIDRDKAAPWLPVEGMKWNYESAPRGLQCLDEWMIDGQRIPEHIYRKGGYYRSYHRRQADYVIPSLGVVVGGFDPR